MISINDILILLFFLLREMIQLIAMFSWFKIIFCSTSLRIFNPHLTLKMVLVIGEILFMYIKNKAYKKVVHVVK